MSRSGYSDDCDDVLKFGRWRGIIASATRGKRGQAFFKDLVKALDEMPEKRLIANSLQEETGEVCAIGALGVKRGVDMKALDPEDFDAVATEFNIATPLAQEVVYMNDEFFNFATPEERWAKMRQWAQEQITE